MPESGTTFKRSFELRKKQVKLSFNSQLSGNMSVLP